MNHIAKIFIAAAGLVVAQQSTERLDMVIREDFFAGLSGDTERFERAMQKCEEELAKNPKNYSAMVWHGGGLYFRAGQAFQRGDTAKGIELNQRGLKEMADAVALAPDSLQTRIPRGSILLGGARYVDEAISKPMIEIAATDYEKAFELQKTQLKNLSTHSEGELLGALADIYRRLGDSAKSREYLQRIVDDLPGTPYEKQARRWMADLTAVPRQPHFCLGCHTESKARP